MTPTLLFDDVPFTFDPAFFPVGEDPGGDPGGDVLDSVSFDEDPDNDEDVLNSSGAVPFCTTR